jgi:WD40 repeat protein
MKIQRNAKSNGLLRRFTIGAAAAAWLSLSIDMGCSALLADQPVTSNDVEGISIAFQLQSLTEHDQQPVVTAMCISPDNRLLAAAGDDHAVRIIDLATQGTLQTLIAHTDWVQAVEFSHDGRSLVSVGNDRTVRIWDRVTNELDSQWQPTLAYTADNALYTVTIHPDNDRIAFSGFGPTMWVYSRSSGSVVDTHTCDCHDQRILRYIHDGEQLACGGRDGVVRIWETETHREIATLPLHRSRIRGMVFSKNESIVSTVAEDRRLIRYDLLTDTKLLDERLVGGKLYSLAHVDSQLLGIGSSDNTLRLFSLVENVEVARLIGHEGTVDVLCVSDSKIVSGSHDTKIRVWDISKTWEEKTQIISTTTANTLSNPQEPKIR